MKQKLPLLTVALVAAAVGVRLPYLHWLHALNWDEVEFFRATEWVRQGLVPYRDFWEHHTPLQWFLFAPAAALTRSPGVGAIVWMRWAQILVWVATFVMLARLMGAAGASRWSRWAAMAAALSSSMFMIPAVEYRIDAVGCMFYVAGVLLLCRTRRRAGAFLAGVAFCLAGFANLRLGPVLAITVLLARIIDLEKNRWSGNVRINWTFAGTLTTLAAASLYFIGTDSVGSAFRHLWTENYIADKYADPPLPFMFLHRLTIWFGIRLLDHDLIPQWEPESIDIAAISLMVIGGAFSIKVLLAGRRKPDVAFFIAILGATNLLFIASMQFAYNYHFLLVVLLLVPFVALGFDAFIASGFRYSRQIVTTLLVLAGISNAAFSLFRGKEDDMAYQDTIMRTAHEVTAEHEPVFDGAGWALRRPVAYRHWFLREIVFVLTRRGVFEPYTLRDLIHRPPGAIVADYSLAEWLYKNRDVGRFAVAHYLPLWKDLWVPGLSARVAGGGGANWLVLASGSYTIYAAPRLASHPWFYYPVAWDRPAWHSRQVAVTDADRGKEPDLRWLVDGHAVVPSSGRLTLRRGQRLAAVSNSPEALGVMLVRGDAKAMFRRPPPGVTLEAALRPTWHLPKF